MTHAVEGAESAELTVNDVLFSFKGQIRIPRHSLPTTSVGSLRQTRRPESSDNPARANITSLFYPNVTNYSGGLIIPQAAYEALGTDGMVTHPVGTGPFMFSNYNPQNSIELVANPDYFRGAPQLDEVHVVYLPDSTSRELALESGDLEVIRGVLEASWVDRINETEDLTADVFGVGEEVWFNFNTEHEILQDIRVRGRL